jgi:hypothetical protein
MASFLEPFRIGKIGFKTYGALHCALDSFEYSTVKLLQKNEYQFKINMERSLCDRSKHPASGAYLPKI